MSFIFAEESIVALAEYRAAYLAFLAAKKMYPHLNHTGHEPHTFGLYEATAEQIRKECERESARGS